jgi:hypothetical protein
MAIFTSGPHCLDATARRGVGLGYTAQMTTFEEKLARVEAANALAASLKAKGVDLKSTEAVPVGLELIHAVDALAQEFGYKILKPIREK